MFSCTFLRSEDHLKRCCVDHRLFLFLSVIRTKRSEAGGGGQEKRWVFVREQLEEGCVLFSMYFSQSKTTCLLNLIYRLFHRYAFLQQAKQACIFLQKCVPVQLFSIPPVKPTSGYSQQDPFKTCPHKRHTHPTHVHSFCTRHEIIIWW